MTKDETKKLLTELHQMCQRFPTDSRGMMWDAVITSLAMDIGEAHLGNPPSEWFDKVAGAAVLDVTTMLAERNGQNPGPVMATMTPGEARAPTPPT